MVGNVAGDVPAADDLNMRAKDLASTLAEDVTSVDDNDLVNCPLHSKPHR